MSNSLTSVWLEPPLLLVCLTHGSETLTAISDAGRFGVDVLRAGQRDLSDRFRPSRRRPPVDWKYHHVGAHLLSGTLPPNHGQI